MDTIDAIVLFESQLVALQLARNPLVQLRGLDLIADRIAVDVAKRQEIG